MRFAVILLPYFYHDRSSNECDRAIVVVAIAQMRGVQPDVDNVGSVRSLAGTSKC